ncbi:MAG: PD40 domain-containing protein [Deltaproteobacteria bacterium]|nr:PD40 domain-containing protein [Deltaproteobacteria bacterium]
MKSNKLYLLLSFVFIWCLTGCENANHTRIVFMQGPPGSIWGNLYTIDNTGNNIVQLTSSGMDAYPRWSPEKDKIVFNRRAGGTNGNWDIYIISPDGTGETGLITGAKDDIYPSWSPDGYKLAFVRLHRSMPGGKAIIVYNIRTHNEEILDDFAIIGRDLNLYGPCWSPDGDKIAFYGAAKDNSGIYTISYPAGIPWEYMRVLGSQPDWASKDRGGDKGKIVYRRNGIHVMNGNGLEDRLIYNLGENPKWSVNFNEIVFQKINTSGSAPYTNQIYKIQENGTLPVQLTNNPLLEHKYPHW